MPDQEKKNKADQKNHLEWHFLDKQHSKHRFEVEIETLDRRVKLEIPVPVKKTRPWLSVVGEILR